MLIYSKKTYKRLFVSAIVLFLLLIFALDYHFFSNTDVNLNTYLMHKGRRDDPIYDTVRKVTCNVLYTFEDNGRCRFNSYNAIGTKTKYALFLGCSYTFGVGVVDDKTLPAYFSRLAPEYRTYNFAYPGWGPHQSLFIMDKGYVRNIVNEKDGVGFYTYIDDQAFRVNGTLCWSANFNFPCYRLRQNKLVFLGTFYQAGLSKYFLFKIYRVLNFLFMEKGHYTLHEFNKILRAINFPKPNQQDYILTVAILEAIQNEYKAQFHNDNFYVVLYPYKAFESFEDKYNLRKMLTERKIKYLEPGNLFPLAEIDYSTYVHPSALANKKMAEYLLSIVQGKPAR
jgi:hypothetical protein